MSGQCDNNENLNKNFKQQKYYSSFPTATVYAQHIQKQGWAREDWKSNYKLTK